MTSATMMRGIAVALLVPGLSLACGRVKSDPSHAGGASGSGGAGGTSAAAGDSANAGASPDALPPTGDVLHDESAGRLVMRRITNREYSNIMADLLGDSSDPGANFPVDGPSPTGFEAPNSVGELNVQYYNETADRLAETALTAGKLGLPSACTSPAATDEEACATKFIAAFGGKAYRRPITADESADLLVLFHAARDPVPAGAALSFAEAVAQMAKGMLQSPNFLYHWELGPTKRVLDPASQLVPLTPHQIASRLAEMLWESMPDSTLLSAADAGQLSTPEQIQAQALRLLGDAHAAKALYNFHAQWLLQESGHTVDLKAIAKAAPAFTPAVAASLSEEFTRFLVSVYGAGGDGTLKTLLTARYTYANADTAPLYGVPAAAGSDFARIELDPSQRGGILTQTAFLAANADAAQSNPVKRGLAVYVNMLCGDATPAPHGVPNLPPAAASLTTRQRFEQQAQGACAVGCHALFNPPGFAFENYDALGAYRTTESGAAVDAAGSFVTPAGSTIAFQNAVDLSNSLAKSSEVQWCVDRQWLRYTLGRLETDAERGSLERAYRKAGETTGYSLREMVLSIVGSVSFRFRAPSAGEVL